MADRSRRRIGGASPQSIHTGYENQVSMKRFIDARDIAASAVLFGSLATRFITGLVWPVVEIRNNARLIT